jgi:hypothetical protein
MKGLIALGIAAGLVAAGAPSLRAQDVSHIVVKQAIADTMTPEQLLAYKQRLARNFENYVAPGASGPRLPADTCTAATYEISTLPYNNVNTTAGRVDDYDLPPDTTAPTCTASSNCVGAPSGRGFIYTGTGTAPDFAYRIRTSAACTLTITATPQSAWDLSLIVYQANCSNNLADCACVDDTGFAGTAESVSLSAVAGTDYFVLVDGYSTGGTPPGPSGAFSLSITGAGCTLLPVELQKIGIQ